jgi:membrane protein DedA with SNARE-associated domain
LLIACVLALVPAGAASAAPQELIPGLTFDRTIEFTTRGPVVANVLTAPRPGGLWQLKPALSNETIPATETLTAIERRYSTGATVAGVNGDLFGPGGAPSGILMRSGALEQPPQPRRSSIGVDSSGTLTVARVSMLATWQGSGPRRALSDVNGPPASNSVSLFTPAWGPTTPASPGSVQITLLPFAAAAPNQELAAPVVAVSSNGGTAIPAGGAVLVARGTAATRLQAEAPVGGAVKIRLILKPAWSSVVDAIGGGPVLVRNGKPVFRANEDFTPDQLLPRTARTAVGQLADGRFLLVTVDGAQPGWSAGVTNFELALLMVKLGAVTAAALDGGRSATMAFDGQLLSRPTGPERPIGDALLVSYGGVYAPQPLEPVLSPNGDGVADTQHLSYKVVRPSTVTASLLGPDGAPRYSFSGPAAPGTYPLDWSGTKPDGTPEAEGRWRWVVSATDDAGQASTVERQFLLDLTLGFPAPVPPALAAARRCDLQAHAGRDGRVQDRDPVRGRAAHALQAARERGRRRGHMGRTYRRRRGGLLRDVRRSRHCHGGDRDGHARGDLQRPPCGSEAGPSTRRAEEEQEEVISPDLLLASITHGVTTFVGNHGLYAVFALMCVDAVFPAASELVMIYGGALAGGALAGGHVVLFGSRIDSAGWGFVAVSLAGTLGYLLGSLLGWGIGAYGGRPLLERRGRWFHLTPENLARAEAWFDRRGDWAVFLGRVTPVVRSFISIPAGVFRSPLARYTVLTLAGSAIWCFAFAGAGWGVGTGYRRVHEDFRWVDYAVVAAVVLAAAWLLLRLRSRKVSRRADEPTSP